MLTAINTTPIQGTASTTHRNFSENLIANLDYLYTSMGTGHFTDAVHKKLPRVPLGTTSKTNLDMAFMLQGTPGKYT